VDDALAEVASLTGVDAFGAIHPSVPMAGPSFSGLDAEALMQGHVQGANAATAVMTKVGDPPRPRPRDVTTRVVAASTALDADQPFIDAFYNVLAELHAQTRRWADRAAAGEEMHPPLMAALWKRAVDACEKRGERTTDAFGRRLTLSGLPSDLLALTNPRRVLSNAARLPEDVEDWAAYVAKEQP
jgi:hypothetical protein